MPRIMASDEGLREVDSISGRRRYRRQRDGSFNVSDRDAKALVEWGGFVPSGLGTTRRHLGFRCTACGFGCWFTTCSRCGGVATRET